MYYLQSRYYDPVVCRFINADSALYGTLQGYNLFLYCENNPVTRVDYNGDMWQFVPALDPRNMLYGEGGSNGLFGCHLGYNYSGSYDSSAYGTYVIKTNTAYADARLGGYYFSGGGYIGGFTGQYATGGTVSVTDSMANRVIKYGKEVKLSSQISIESAVDAWNDFLGPNQNSYNYFTGSNQADRIFSADGFRSIRFGNHEIKSMGTPKAHFHYEIWSYDRINNIVYVKNILQRLK
jgi:hypothetical protein